MSVDSQTQFQNKNSAEEHVQEVNNLLGDIEQVVNETPNTSYQIEIERSTPYQDENDWETETSMTRGFTPLEDDEKLTDPEQHALGSQKLKEEYGMDATSIAEITMDGIGELSSVRAQYSIELNFDEEKGLNYELERNNVNASSIEDQPVVQQDLKYIETQMENVINEYNEPELQQQAAPNWTYGQQRVQALDD